MSGTDIHGNTMLLTLGNQQLGREGLCSREIQISAPNPLMGCMVREAVLWRLKQYFQFQKTVERDKRGGKPDRRGSSQTMEHVLALLVGELDLAVQDAKNLNSLWRANHLKKSGMS